MGNHAAAKEIIALIHGPLVASRLSVDAILQSVDSFYAGRRIDPEFAPISERAILFYRPDRSWQRSAP